MSRTPTNAPSAPSRWAVARPSPEPAPVTTATRSVKRAMTSPLLGAGDDARNLTRCQVPAAVPGPCGLTTRRPGSGRAGEVGVDGGELGTPRSPDETKRPGDEVFGHLDRFGYVTLCDELDGHRSGEALDDRVAPVFTSDPSQLNQGPPSRPLGSGPPSHDQRRTRDPRWPRGADVGPDLVEVGDGGHVLVVPLSASL